VDVRRSGGGLLDVDDGRQDLVLDRDELGGVARAVRRRGDDDRDGIGRRPRTSSSASM